MVSAHGFTSSPASTSLNLASIHSRALKHVFAPTVAIAQRHPTPVYTTPCVHDITSPFLPGAACGLGSSVGSCCYAPS